MSRLVEAGVAPRETLESALEGRQDDALSDAEVLVAAGLPEWPIYEVLAAECHLPLVHVEGANLDRRLVARISREVAEHYAMIPLAVSEGRLRLAMADPLDVIGEDVVRFATGLEVERVVAPRSEILRALREAYAEEVSVGSLLDRIPDSDLEFRADHDEDPEPTDQEHQSRPVIALVNRVLSDAINMEASDIHVEPREEGLRVRYRVDGVLRTVVELPRKVQSACLSRLKLMAGMDIAERRVPQDGRFRIALKDRDVDLRVSSLPGSRGEKIVLRILDRRGHSLTLDDLSFSKHDYERLLLAVDAPQGMVLITGPTGSGKTTTLYAALDRLNREGANLVTVEDPIEYELPGVHQVSIREKAGLTFARALRSILRQDPDVVMVGEIRDPETAEIALQAAQTGHLVLSTLHTNDASQSVTRLLQMGVPAYLVGSALLCVVAQRLVRRLCVACRQPETCSPSLLEIVRSAAPGPLPAEAFAAAGCEECHHTGFRGRVGLYEVLPITDRLRALIVQNAPALTLARAAREEGMRSLLEDGLTKVAQGLTSLDELLRVVQIRAEGQRLCLSCERPLQEDFLFCPFCTQGLTRFCPACHKGVRADWAACPYCGCALAETPPSASPTPGPALGAPAPGPAPLPSPPLSPAGAAEAAPETADVLVVTSDGTLLTVLRTLLERAGYRVLAGGSQQEGVSLARTRLPRLVLADLSTLTQPPAFVAALRSQLGTSLVPLLLLTLRGPDGLLEGLALQADDYLLKPVEPAPLLTKVARLLRRSRG